MIALPATKPANMQTCSDLARQAGRQARAEAAGVLQRSKTQISNTEGDCRDYLYGPLLGLRG